MVLGAVRRYFDRGSEALPYGAGSLVHQIVGIAQGGAYEWDERTFRKGITAIKLSPEGLITQLTSIWGVFGIDNGTVAALAQLSIEGLGRYDTILDRWER